MQTFSDIDDCIDASSVSLEDDNVDEVVSQDDFSIYNEEFVVDQELEDSPPFDFEILKVCSTTPKEVHSKNMVNSDPAIEKMFGPKNCCKLKCNKRIPKDVAIAQRY